MVEQKYSLDTIFNSLSNPTRRDILKRISTRSMNVGAIAQQYTLSFAGVAKHLGVLERAGLIKKTRQGKEQIITVDPIALAAATKYLEEYKLLWEQRLDSLDAFLEATSKKGDTYGR